MSEPILYVEKLVKDSGLSVREVAFLEEDDFVEFVKQLAQENSGDVVLLQFYARIYYRQYIAVNSYLQAEKAESIVQTLLSRLPRVALPAEKDSSRVDELGIMEMTGKLISKSFASISSPMHLTIPVFGDNLTLMEKSAVRVLLLGKNYLTEDDMEDVYHLCVEKYEFLREVSLRNNEIHSGKGNQWLFKLTSLETVRFVDICVNNIASNKEFFESIETLKNWGSLIWVPKSWFHGSARIDFLLELNLDFVKLGCEKKDLIQLIKAKHIAFYSE